MGQGLEAFSGIEMEMAKVFAIAARCKDPKTSERIFWSVASLDARIAMTNGALKSAFAVLEESELPDIWADIFNEIKEQKGKRAELAHGLALRMFWRTRKGSRSDVFFAPYFGTYFVDAHPMRHQVGFDPRPKKRLYKDDLLTRREEFHALHLQVREFAEHLKGELAGPHALTEDLAILRKQWRRKAAIQKLREARKPQTPSAE